MKAQINDFSYEPAQQPYDDYYLKHNEQNMYISFLLRQTFEDSNEIHYFNKFISKIQNSQQQSVNYRKYRDLFEKKNYKEKYNARQIAVIIDELFKLNKQNKLKLDIWIHKQIVVLIWLIQKYDMIYSKAPRNFNDQDWQQIALMLPSKNAEECQFRWIQFSKYNLNEYPWTSKQNQILIELVRQYGQKWKQISRILYKKTQIYENQSEQKVYRTPRQCKLQYRCHLNQDLKKGKWTEEEDLQLLNLYLEKNRKWLQISKTIKGRTQNAVKNRFLTIIKQKFKSNSTTKECEQQQLHELIKSYLSNHKANQMIQTNQSNIISLPEQIIVNQNYPVTQKNQRQLEVKESIIAKLPQISITNSKSFDDLLKGAKHIKFKRLGIVQMLKELSMPQGQIYSGVFDKQNFEIKIRQIMPSQKQQIQQKQEHIQFQQPDIFHFFPSEQEQLFKLFDLKPQENDNFQQE